MRCPYDNAKMHEVVRDVETNDGMIRRTRTGRLICPECAGETTRAGGETVEYLDPKAKVR